MNRASRFVVMMAMACLPLLARAEGKCDDDPFVLPDGTLGVAWTIPVLPAASSAEEPAVDPQATLMTDFDTRSPVEPQGFPPEYASNVWRYPYPSHSDTKKTFNNKKSHDDWLGRFGLAEGTVAGGITSKHFARGGKLFGMVVQHPPLPPDKSPPGKSGYELCSCILQRAVLLYDDKTGKEHLWIRSRFRSAKGKNNPNWTNFEPTAPLKFIFKSPTLWFPLAYNEVLPESPAFLVLDVVTRKKLGTVAGFTAEDLGQVTYAVAGQPETWNVTRLRRTFQQGAVTADLSIPPP